MSPPEPVRTHLTFFGGFGSITSFWNLVPLRFIRSCKMCYKTTVKPLQPVYRKGSSSLPLNDVKLKIKLHLSVSLENLQQAARNAPCRLYCSRLLASISQRLPWNGIYFLFLAQYKTANNSTYGFEGVDYKTQTKHNQVSDMYPVYMTGISSRFLLNNPSIR